MGTGGLDPNALTFLRPDGSPVRLRELHAGPVLLVFLRHLV
jgi:hypothetical protein